MHWVLRRDTVLLIRVVCESAYVAAWADYLRFIGKHPSLFPSLSQLLAPTSLETSGIHSIASLRDACEPAISSNATTLRLGPSRVTSSCVRS